MRWLRAVFFAYLTAASVLLLAPNPLALLGIERPVGPPGGHGVHLVLFAILAFLAWVSRFPIGPRWVLVVLLSYAGATELLQSLIPHRSVEMADAIENVLGIGLGIVIASNSVLCRTGQCTK